MTSSLTISSLTSELVEFRGCCLQEALIPCLVEPKLLVIKGGYFNQIISEVSIGPLWLSWSNIGQRYLPPRLTLKNLRVLEISGEPREDHFEELWKAESNAPVQLRELVISSCYKFKRLPISIGCLTELKKIVINRSDNIRRLPKSFCRLQQLEHLQLHSCIILSSLPSRFGDLTNLRYLDLSYCSDLKNLPVSFRNLSLLQHLNLDGCGGLIVEPGDFQNITKLEFLTLDGCRQLEELPRHITNQASLREFYLSDVKRLREVPIEIGQLGRLRKLRIGSDLLISLPNSLGCLSLLTHLSIDGCPNLESLPTSLGRLSCLIQLEISSCAKLESLPSSLGLLSPLTYLKISSCPKLESLPTSLGALSSLTCLTIQRCPKITRLPFSVGRLSLLQDLHIYECPIIQVDFDVASSSSTISSNLSWVKIEGTKVCRISICEDRYPGLERLYLFHNDQLTEVEALPVSLECLSIRGSPKLVVIPSFARLTSLRELQVRGFEKIDGLKDCTGLEKLSVETSGEVLGIESLEKMENLRTLELRASKGSAIVSCIQTIKKWPDQITVCTRAVPDAASLLLDSSILSSNVFIVESLRLKPNRVPPESLFSEEMKSLFNDSSMNGNAMMLCFVINSVRYPQVRIEFCQGPSHATISSIVVSEGRWAVIGVFTRRCTWLTASLKISLSANKVPFGGTRAKDVIVEGCLAVGGEEQRLVEAFLPLLQSISN